jgi:hypothetical protein
MIETLEHRWQSDRERDEQIAAENSEYARASRRLERACWIAITVILFAMAVWTQGGCIAPNAERVTIVMYAGRVTEGEPAPIEVENEAPALPWEASETETRP